MAKVKSYMESYDASLGEWKRFAFWDEKCNYTRNLIATDNKTFTLMLLCWNSNKASPIHDHAGSECFMRIIEGEVVEIRCEMPKEENKPLVVTQKTTLAAPCVAFINDSIGLHKIENSSSKRAVSLHCYMPPYDSCHCFITPDVSAKASTCNVTFYSENGSRTKH